uniref:8-oxo-dGTP diphosphatase n=1 Tax=uncultured Thiotrichaceae bacterium TaxID=298394 RepID=A0A6S6U450_9GAMM|nr:MAG: Unknown protein [uncultured Thiotrichaceae bacterium]
MPNTEASSDSLSADEQWLHVVAAVILSEDERQILLARRPQNKHQGGKWEFPGGKVESCESVTIALQRELDEELGINATLEQMSQYIEVHHRYPDINIFLDVWVVKGFAGTPYGKEGQEIRWFSKQELLELEFPAANAPILNKLLA